MVDYMLVISYGGTVGEAGGKLVQQVGSLIDKGYKPLGGVSTTQEKKQFTICQAMIKE